MRPDDMLVSVRSRKLACVLDPALILGSPFGLSFALRLTQVLEPWLTRAFWQLVDASELVIPQLGTSTPPDIAALQPLGPVLQGWIALRDHTDAGSWPFRWVGDRLAESQLQDPTDTGLIGRYEALAETLFSRTAHDPPPGRHPWPLYWDPLRASLDTLALSAALDGAIVLMAQAASEEPWPVQALRCADLQAELLDPVPSESLFSAERALLRDALAAAGLASLAPQLPRLAALHVTVAGLAQVASMAELVAHGEPGVFAAEEHPAIPANLWSVARAWWYYV